MTWSTRRKLVRTMNTNTMNMNPDDEPEATDEEEEEEEEDDDDDDTVAAGLPGLPDAAAAGFYCTPTLDLRGPTACGAPLRCINNDAVWTLSSARPGNGVDALLRSNEDTYWQSDGPLPHTVTIQLFRRQSIAELALFLSFGDDDSYTPEKFTVRCSSGLRDDLADLRHIELPAGVRVNGWIRVPLHAPGKRGAQRFLRTNFLQLSVSYMYSNGRDLRIRSMQVLSPDEAPGAAAPAAARERFSMPAWETPEMALSAGVR